MLAPKIADFGQFIAKFRFDNTTGIRYPNAIIATNRLVIKGGKSDGPHLNLLGQHFVGYRVSVPESFIGFTYGFAVRTLSGTLIGWICNTIAAFRSR